jgi:hypothetical protein
MGKVIVPEGITVRQGTSEDDFIRNLSRFVFEERLNFGVEMPSANTNVEHFADDCRAGKLNKGDYEARPFDTVRQTRLTVSRSTGKAELDGSPFRTGRNQTCALSAEGALRLPGPGRWVKTGGKLRRVADFVAQIKY